LNLLFGVASFDGGCPPGVREAPGVREPPGVRFIPACSLPAGHNHQASRSQLW
jgi:hypothetical protein